jgi:MoaA/NifB/PqqE/SkfB family radical SAM enzyme
MGSTSVAAAGRQEIGVNNRFYLKIFVTYRCNIQCRHCVQSRISSRFASSMPEALYLDHLNRFLASAADTEKDLRIYVSGGEPLLSPRFFNTARMIKDRGLSYKTMTNGLLLDRTLDRLLEAPPRGIWVTFNGTGQRHDRVVGLTGGYERLCRSVAKSIPALQKAGSKVGTVLMINSLTAHRLASDLDEIAALEFDEVVLQHLSFLPPEVIDAHQTAFHQAFDRESLFCFGEMVDGTGIDPVKLYDQLMTLKNKTHPFRLVIFPPLETLEQLTDYYGPAPVRWRNRRCQRALHELWLHPDGTAAVCFSLPVGDFRQSLQEIRESSEYLHWQAHFRELPGPLPGCMRCHRLYM